MTSSRILFTTTLILCELSILVNAFSNTIPLKECVGVSRNMSATTSCSHVDILPNGSTAALKGVNTSNQPYLIQSTSPLKRTKKREKARDATSITERRFLPIEVTLNLANVLRSVQERILAKNVKLALLQFHRLFSVIQQSWWCVPMAGLISVPLYSAIVHGSYATMPTWWALQNVGYLRNMPALCLTFLGSNIFYFLSGLLLLNRISIPIGGGENSNSNDDILNEHQTIVKKGAFFHTSRHFPLLGWSVLTSGAISVVYHAFQALGNVGLAESLCFVDHGMALSSGFYFFHKCGLPSLKTLAIGVPSLGLLACPGDMYPVLHSLWHVASAGTTVSWALDGVEKRKRYIASNLHDMRGRCKTIGLA